MLPPARPARRSTSSRTERRRPRASGEPAVVECVHRGRLRYRRQTTATGMRRHRCSRSDSPEHHVTIRPKGTAIAHVGHGATKPMRLRLAHSGASHGCCRVDNATPTRLPIHPTRLRLAIRGGRESEQNSRIRYAPSPKIRFAISKIRYSPLTADSKIVAISTILDLRTDTTGTSHRPQTPTTPGRPARHRCPAPTRGRYHPQPTLTREAPPIRDVRQPTGLRLRSNYLR